MLEIKSLELYGAFRQLEAEAQNLELTVQKRTRELQHALEQAEAAARAKSAFLATMSHELRTPLNGVLAVSELLFRSGLNNEQSHWVQTIASSGQNLLALLNEILDFSKIEAQQLRLERAVFSSMQTLTEACEMLSAQAQMKGLVLHCSHAPDVPQAIWGDSIWLKQIWTNLLGNALKFTERGSVSARLWVDARTTGIWLCGEVEDTGIGMSSAVRQRIFHPFVQADNSTTRKFGGTGLGLVITRRILELMGGQIELDSTEGTGSSFRFSWPVEPASADALPVLAPQMDVQMPELDGLQVTETLRSLSLPVQPWVIALTANVYPEDRTACAAAGMNDFLSKPISLTDLSQALKRSMRP